MLSVIAEIEVVDGKRDDFLTEFHKVVPLVLADRLAVTLPTQSRSQIQVIIRYDAPIPAPIRKGDRLGVLQVTAPGFETVERPLIAGADVGALGPVGRVLAVTQHWLASLLP